MLKHYQMPSLTSPRINNLPQTVGRALDILEALMESNEALGITDLSRRVNLNKSTTYRIVQALRTRNYINQDHQTNKYCLGHKIVRLASSFLNQNKLRELARTHLEELSKKTSQTIQLAIWEGDKVVYIDQVEGTDIFQVRLRIGDRGPLHCTAAGKSILAFLPEGEAEKILKKAKFVPFTDKTITSMSQLRNDLGKIRRVGFSFSDQEYDKNLRAIGAPIIGMGSRVIGAIALVAPYNRIKVKEVSHYGSMVRGAGLKISLVMGGQIEREGVERL
jgi:DNA-binding IclR family transcriptional regulator